jgi:hypothetical protein
MTIDIKPRSAAVFLGVIIVFLALAHLLTVVSTYYWGHNYVLGLVPLFNMDEEQNLPTYFSSAQILLCSCLAFAIAVAEKNRRRRDYLYWIGLCLICLYISVDEFASIHERFINQPFRDASNGPQRFYFSWVIPYGILVVAVVTLYVRFILRLPREIGRLIVVSGFVYVTSTVGLELIGGRYCDTHTGPHADLVLALLVMCEETLEKAAILVLVYALMSYLSRYVEGCTFRITSSPSD